MKRNQGMKEKIFISSVMTGMAIGLTSEAYEYNHLTTYENRQLEEINKFSMDLYRIQPIVGLYPNKHISAYGFNNRNNYTFNYELTVIERSSGLIKHIHAANDLSDGLTTKRSFNQSVKSVEISTAQKKLQHLGYYNGLIDGISGPKTRSAIVNFQSDHRLTINGILTSETYKKLDDIKVIVKKKESITYPQNVTPIKISEDFITNAKQFIGTPYVWGGSTPTGFDCSGFITYIFHHYKEVKLPRTVSDIWNNTVSVKEPEVGDLVFFETYKPGPSHAGIYLGNGNFLHSGLSNGVSISNIASNYWKKRYLGAKRIVKQQ
jgi:cell wall-associated NlpC family hydrolase